MSISSRLVCLKPVLEKALAGKRRLTIKNTVLIDSDPSVPIGSLAKSVGVACEAGVFSQNLKSRLDAVPFVGIVGFRTIPRDMTTHHFLNQASMRAFRSANMRMTLDFIRLHRERIEGARVVCLDSGVLPSYAYYPGTVFIEPRDKGFLARISFDREPLKKGDVIVVFAN